MSPRADFECKKCGTTHEDLPVDAKLCPFTGARRGFKRLYNAVQVNAVGRQIAQKLDPMMQGPMDHKAEIQAGAERFGGALKEAEDRMYHAANPAQREALAAAKMGISNRMIPAGQALGAIDPAGRVASRGGYYGGKEYIGTYPMLTQKTIVPKYER